ncbi:ABC transporter ATP-binding protein [Roseovarius sp. MMSF_3281]|uniref:ABC transporter ATP-binding protein n=1 Tax=Roseovarius sp. MMSF_3281 TaxID=3046694 RepID=UPI00273F9ACC|nr:ABC transporter ATP-binding protein [Roseovarius sp. MMSF_3281]
MIVLRNLTKIYDFNDTRKVVANNINVVFPTGVSVGILGRNGAGKSTLLKVIAGISAPTSGEVLTDGNISFPVGLASSMHPDMTGAQNTRFVARIYGAETDLMARFVANFAELGDHFHLPVRTYSSGMRSRLTFGINMALQFDTYLIDEVTAAGDALFKDKSSIVFKQRMQNSGALFVSHSMGLMRDFCEAGAVLEGGELTYYDDINDAIAHHEQNMRLLRQQRA